MSSTLFTTLNIVLFPPLQSPWSSVLKGPSKYTITEAVLIEIDTAKIFNEDSKKEEKTIYLSKREQCFKCQKQGYNKNDCPNWAK